MTLSFIRSLSKPECDVSRRSQDDIYLRGPIVLTNRHFNALTDYIPLKIMIKTWRLNGRKGDLQLKCCLKSTK